MNSKQAMELVETIFMEIQYSFAPDEVFEESTLEEWARNHGFIKEDKLPE